MTIIINTGNEWKFSIAQKILDQYDVTCEQLKIETPEIQAMDGKEVNEYSARYAFEQVGKPIVVTDAGYYIKELGGFPGPYIKYINEWLTAEDLLRLMDGKKDRSIEIVEYLTYVDEHGELHTFETHIPCTLADEIADNTKGSAIDKLLIFPGHTTQQNLLSTEEQLDFFAKQSQAWHELGKYLET
jgi:XTP/dITP diphosphohydrolase